MLKLYMELPVMKIQVYNLQNVKSKVIILKIQLEYFQDGLILKLINVIFIHIKKVEF